jgi:protein-S-isoprenylcysteine O-methyltransferase Ste14
MMREGHGAKGFLGMGFLSDLQMIRVAGAAIYMMGLAFSEGLRLPHRIARLQHPGTRPIRLASHQISEFFVLVAIVLGFWVLPLAYAFTGWLAPLDYFLPPWMVLVGSVLCVASLLLRLAAHRSLSKQWSFTLETWDNQVLVTSGIYSFMRHPIYAALILWAAAQPFLLQNALAGAAGSLSVLLIWTVRVPREEEMMLDSFGDQYRQYLSRTGRLITLCRKTRV